VTGKIRTEEWNDRETGEKRSKVSLIADAVAVSLQFRPVPHSSKASRSSTRDEADPFASPASQSDSEPPF